MEKKLLSFLSSVFLFLGVNSNAFEYQILDGEQLLGAVYDIKSFTPFDNKCVNFLYYIDFQDNGEIYVHNSNMVVSGYPTLSELKQGQGFIVNASGNCNVTINEPSETIVFQGLTYKTIQSPTTNRIWLDRNLGALKVCDKKRSDFNTKAAYIESQQDCFGDYYQWGRPADGHQLVTSLTTSSLKSSITPSSSTFSYNTMDRYDWVSNSVDTYGENRKNNWELTTGSGNAICPIGFRVPTSTEWNNEVINVDRSTFENTFKIPYSGYRIWSNGNVIVKGDYTELWSSTPLLKGSKSLTFSDLYLGTGDYDYYDWRANGMNVRCIKQ